VRIAVVNLVSVDGGGWMVLRDLHAFATGRDNDHEWLFVLGPQVLDESALVRVVRSSARRSRPLRRLTLDTLRAGRAIQQFGPDMTLSLQNSRLRGARGPQVIYLQQSIPFQRDYAFGFHRPGEFWLAVRQHLHGRLIKRSLSRTQGVFVQAEWMREAVAALVPAQVPVVNVGPPALPRPVPAPLPTTAPAPESAGTVGAFFFYPAGPAVYKNFERLHAAVRLAASQGSRLPLKLTLDEREFRRLSRAAETDPLDGVELLGRITPEEVDRLYRDAVLVFPSFIETVGLPLVEARRHGRHIIVSDCAFAREVLDGYPNAVFVDPFDVDAWARALLRVARGEVLLAADPQPPAARPASWEVVVGSIERLVLGAAS
jgi:glycosyltransferase involved in cell wall biosynthesis